VFRELCRVLAPTGSLWVQIRANVQAEACLLLKRVGLHWRDTAFWHYGRAALPCHESQANSGGGREGLLLLALHHGNLIAGIVELDLVKKAADKEEPAPRRGNANFNHPSCGL
jgi:hypothetical protein